MACALGVGEAVVALGGLAGTWQLWTGTYAPPVSDLEPLGHAVRPAQVAGEHVAAEAEVAGVGAGHDVVLVPEGEEPAANALLVKVNSDDSPELSQRFRIRSIPTLALFQGGREIARQAGAMGAADIVRWARANAQRP